MSSATRFRQFFWGGLCGPVLFYDLVRRARRGRHFLVRFLYVLGLSLAFGCCYWLWVLRFSGGAIAPDDLADFNQLVFLGFLGVQFVLVALLTPTYVGGALAEEKENRTLEFLLATDLGNREIVFGKFAARLGHVLLIVLAGLPLLSILQVLGGIDPQLLLAGYAATLVTVWSLAGLSLLVSLYARRVWTAIVLTEVAALGYLLLSAGSLMLYDEWNGGPYLMISSLATIKDNPAGWMLLALNTGNIAIGLCQLFHEILRGTALDDFLPALVRQYVLFHVLCGIICLTWTTWRLRAVTLKETLQSYSAASRWFRRRRPVGDRPVLWKELRFETGLLGHWLGRLYLFILALTCFVPAVANLFDDQIKVFICWWCLGPVVACLALLRIALRAAGSVTRERQQATLDSLLTTPLGSDTVLTAKWVGCLWTVKWEMLWLVATWLQAKVAVDLLALPLESTTILPFLVVATVIFACLAAWIGLWCSVSYRSTLSASIATLLVLLAVGLGHWLLWVVYVPFFILFEEAEPVIELLFRLHLGLTPPVVLSGYPIISQDVKGLTHIDIVSFGELAAIGLFCHGMLALLLALWTHARFRTLAGERPIAPEIDASTVTSEEDIRLLLRRAERRGRRRRRLAWALAVGTPVALIAGLYLTMIESANRNLRHAIANVDAADPRWRFEDILSDRAEVPDAENSAGPILKAVSLLPKNWPAFQPTITTGNAAPKDLYDLLKELSPNVRLNRTLNGLVDEKMELVEAALLPARSLADLPRGRFALTIPKNVWATPLNHVQDTRQIANLLRLDATRRAQDGDIEGAWHSVRAGVNTARALGDEPLLITMLVRCANLGIAFSTMERILAQGEVSAASLKQMQDLLAREIDEPVLLVAMRGERAFAHATFEEIDRGDLKLSLLLGWAGVVMPGSPVLDFFAPLACKPAHAWTLRWHGEVVAAVAKLPLHEQAAALQELETRAKNGPKLASLLVSASVRPAGAHQRVQACLRCAKTACAVERYRLRHGHWPERLDDLVPAFLDAVPLDPYDGAALRYQMLDDGVVIYSLGPDQTDDSGNIDRQNPIAKGSDLGFQLWDVSTRAQAPE